MGSKSLKYLEKGHIYMKPDSIHGLIGKKLKNKQKYLLFPISLTWWILPENLSKPVVLGISDFYEFCADNSTRKSKHVTLPLLTTICCVTFRKDSMLMFYQTDFDVQEHALSVVWTVIDILRADAAKASPTLLKYVAGSLPRKRC